MSSLKETVHAMLEKDIFDPDLVAQLEAYVTQQVTHQPPYPLNPHPYPKSLSLSLIPIPNLDPKSRSQISIPNLYPSLSLSLIPIPNP